MPPDNTLVAKEPEPRVERSEPLIVWVGSPPAATGPPDSTAIAEPLSRIARRFIRVRAAGPAGLAGGMELSFGVNIRRSVADDKLDEPALGRLRGRGREGLVEGLGVTEVDPHGVADLVVGKAELDAGAQRPE